MVPRSGGSSMGLVSAWLLMLLAALVFRGLPARCEGNADRIAELMELQERAADAVIRLDDNNVKRFALQSEGRPYSLVLFFDCEQMRERADTKLQELRREFGLAAAAFAKNNRGKESASKVFFVDLELARSQVAFDLFGVTTLPMIRHLPPGKLPLKDSHPLSVKGLSSKRPADGMAAFVEERTRYRVGPIERPPLVSRQQMVATGIGLALAAPFLIKRLLAGNTPLHNKALWCSGALIAYFCSVSGLVFNVMKDLPLYKRDLYNPNKLIFFHKGPRIQLGAEGLCVGFLYTIVGVLVALISHFVIRIRSPVARRVAMYMGMALSFWAFKTVLDWDQWKTNYEIQFFWPKTPW